MANNYQPQGLAEGIYFDLENEAYHADPALSHSGMTKVLISWPDYWANSCHNKQKPDWKQTQTDPMKFGERSGMYLLEPDTFHRKFNTYTSHKGAGKGIYLSSIEYNKIRDSVDCIREVKIANDYFSHGHPEVSIFWRDPDTNIMLRARIDYLRTFGAIDFKRIKGVDAWSIGAAVRNQGLDIQNWLFLEAIKAARAMLKRGVKPVAGTRKVDPLWLQAFVDDPDLMFRFFFQRSTPPYIWKIRELDPDVLEEGMRATRTAVKLYKDGIARYGISSPPCGDGEVDTVSQFHVPRRNYD